MGTTVPKEQIPDCLPALLPVQHALDGLAVCTVQALGQRPRQPDHGADPVDRAAPLAGDHDDVRKTIVRLCATLTALHQVLPGPGPVSYTHLTLPTSDLV